MPRHQGLNIIDFVLLNYDRNKRMYGMLFIIYILGISAGAFWINGMGYEQQTAVVAWLDSFVEKYMEARAHWTGILIISLMRNLFLAFTIWFLGTSIAGKPLNHVILGIKGFITGLSSGFFIKFRGLMGIGYSLLAILPEEIVAVPIILTMAGLSIKYSALIKDGRQPLRIALRKYTAEYSVCTFLFCVLSLFDALYIPKVVEALFVRS